MLASEQMAVVKEHQKRAPVPTVKIAHDLGLKVFKVRNWPVEISGMITAKGQNDDRKYRIYVNGLHSETRRRFTIAHEISHFLLHSHLIGDGLVEDAMLRAEGLSNHVEAEANRMAADILMPWNLITENQEKGINTIEGLAQEFNVSRDAMSIRLLGVRYSEAKDTQVI